MINKRGTYYLKKTSHFLPVCPHISLSYAPEDPIGNFEYEEMFKVRCHMCHRSYEVRYGL